MWEAVLKYILEMYCETSIIPWAKGQKSLEKN